jgi:hypothetical protein
MKTSGIENDALSEYGRGFIDGLDAAIRLCRAGATGDDLALLLHSDPGALDPRGYSDQLGALRQILGVNDVICS